MKNLETLSVPDAALTDEALEYIIRMPNLKFLGFGTDVSPAFLKKLEAARPDLYDSNAFSF